jgi:putative ABC transport system permease protein
VIGILGGMEDPLFDETILIPFTVARSRFAYMYEIKDIYVRAVNWDIVGQLQQQIYESLLRNRPAFADSVEVRFFPERIQTVQRAVLLVKVFLYFALLVTLVLGGLGITNVMLAAVQERTTEIGLRKAVGATDKMIMSQFLLESVGISITGAIIGTLSGYLVVEWLIRIFQTIPDQQVFYASLIGGVLFSVILGVASGLLPARRASQLDAAEAMSFE